MSPPHTRPSRDPAGGRVPPPCTRPSRDPTAGRVSPPRTRPSRDPAAGRVPPPRTRPSRAPGRAGLHRLKFSHAIGVCQAGPASPRNLGHLVPARSDPAEPTFPGWVSARSGQVRSGGRVGHGGVPGPGPGAQAVWEGAWPGGTPAASPGPPGGQAGGRGPGGLSLCAPCSLAHHPPATLQGPAPRWAWGAAGEAPGSPPQEPSTQRGTQERETTSRPP